MLKNKVLSQAAETKTRSWQWFICPCKEKELWVGAQRDRLLQPAASMRTQSSSRQTRCRLLGHGRPKTQTGDKAGRKSMFINNGNKRPGDNALLILEATPSTINCQARMPAFFSPPLSCQSKIEDGPKPLTPTQVFQTYITEPFLKF